MQPVPFADLPRPVQVQLLVGGPLLFGAVCGFVLSESKTGWLVLQLVAALGGLLAGLEHHGARGGALRGLAAGALFGTGIVIADAVSSAPPAADVPDPMVLMIVITALIGTLLGAVGGAISSRRAHGRSAS